MTSKRAAIYARYSTDHQNDRSIEDQVELCRVHAAKSGFSVTVEYSDRARTSASLFGRDGILDLIEDAKAGRFDAVIVESLDRVSRDQADLAGVFKRLSHYGVQIVAVHDGIADAVQVGLRGLMGSIFLSDLKNKTRRGMAGVVREGRSAGGRAFGYRPVPGRPGELAIEPDEAATILRIFTEYSEGASPRAIATGLNRDRAPAPRGARWNASTINGNPARGYGILSNALYGGVLVWNRIRMVRDPDTGKRVSRVNPESEWQRSPADHLRIVPQGLIEAVAERRGAPRKHAKADKKTRLLSGLLRCGACGSGMSMSGSGRGGPRIVCSAARESGTCDAKRRVFLEPIEQTVIAGVREQISSPEMMARYVERFNAKRSREVGEATRERSKAERRLAEVERDIDRIVDGLGAGILTQDDVKRRLPALRDEAEALQRRIDKATQDQHVVALHPAAIEAYQTQLALLGSTLTAAVSKSAKARDAFRGLVDSVIVTIGDRYEAPTVEVRGRLAALLGTSIAPDGAMPLAECGKIGGIGGSGRGT